jgi:hypothetical protein
MSRLMKRNAKMRAEKRKHLQNVDWLLHLKQAHSLSYLVFAFLCLCVSLSLLCKGTTLTMGPDRCFGIPSWHCHDELLAPELLHNVPKLQHEGSPRVNQAKAKEIGTT